MKSPVEYGSYTDDQRSKVTTLDSGKSPEGEYPRQFYLKHHSAGYEPAGSMARWTDERWGVTFDQGGAINGRRFLTLPPAQDLFNKWTGRDVEVEAQIVRDEIRMEKSLAGR